MANNAGLTPEDIEFGKKLAETAQDILNHEFKVALNRLRTQRKLDHECTVEDQDDASTAP